MKNSRSILVFLIFSFTCLAVSCQKPVKTASNEPREPTGPASSPVTAQTQPPVEASQPPNPAPAMVPDPVPETGAPPADPGSPAGPILEVKEEGNTITISGTLSSRFQAADIVNGISNSFTGAKVVDQLKVNSDIDEVRWGNRVNELLLPFLHHVEDARFFYENGVTHLEGTVKESKLIHQVQELTISVMNDTDARDIKNRLKALNPEAGRKGKQEIPK